MEITAIFAIAIALLFAINMGASGIGPSMAAAFGGGILRRRDAVILFSIFVIIGGIFGSGAVTKTISSKIVEIPNFSIALVILLSATLSLFLANIMKVPQSTSQVTVFAIVGAGLYLGGLNLNTLAIMIPLWFVLPVASYIISYLFGKFIYPKISSWIAHESSKNHRTLLKILVIGSACYVAFAIGTNNVSNAVGPLLGADIIDEFLGIILIAPLFGIGSVILGRGVLETSGREITGLDLVSSSLVSFVTGTLLIFASVIGIPQSLVQLNIASIFAMGSAEHGNLTMLKKDVTTRIAKVWLFSPVFSIILSIILIIFIH